MGKITYFTKHIFFNNFSFFVNAVILTHFRRRQKSKITQWKFPMKISDHNSSVYCA